MAKPIKYQLVKALEQDDLDYDVVLRLAHALAEEDDERVRFSIDASHIDRLGRELVAKQETAVAEMVKNAYDADGTTVALNFIDCYEPGGTLEIVDNGRGMARDELINGFMRLSTQDKVDNPSSHKYGRMRAGRKGIGRFSAQRLGSSLTLLTQTYRAKNALKITIDWDEYLGHKDLYTITNEIEEIDTFRKGYGTTLIIEDLRDGWTDEEIRRTYRYISELLQPFPLSRKRLPAKGKKARDPGFKVEFIRETDGELETIADEEEIFLKHALAVIEGRVNEKGQGFWSVKSKRLGINLKNQRMGPDNEKPKMRYSALRDVQIKAYYFIDDRKKNPFPRNMRTAMRQTLRDHGGIRLYRNGFRVLPYGEGDNDWLRLDYSYRLRHILPQHGNSNFLGFVEVKDERDERFQETSSREGLVENQAYKQLTKFGYTALVSAILEIARVRGIKRTTKEKTKQKGPVELAEEAAVKILKAAASEKDKKKKEEYEQAAEDIRELGQEAERLLQDEIDEKAMLRVLAGMGLTIGEFTHEIRFLMGSLEIDLESIIQAASLKPKQRSILNGFMANLGTLNSYAGYFDKAVSDNVHRQVKPMELRDVVDDFERSTSSWMKRKGVELTHTFDGYDLYACPMHPSEWASIFLNLCTNAVKAIDRAEVDGDIHIRGGESDRIVFIEFSDNGDGIPKKSKDKLFDAFFTTSLPSGPDGNIQTELAGTGLGLKIVKDIIESYGGEISLTKPPNGFSTCFRIEVPRASEEEVSEYAD